MKNLIKGINAGILISIGGAAFLACDIKYIGALLFSVALLCICYRGDNLFTGKICYLPADTTTDYVKLLFEGILGNLIGTVVGGLLYSYISPDGMNKAVVMCTAKLAFSYPQAIVKGIFCGILIYLAVDIFKEQKTTLAIFLCIPAFILSGFEHCIADMFYFAAARIFNLNAIIFIIMVIIGNSIGGMLLPIMKKLTK